MENKNKNTNKGIQLIVILAVIILIVVVSIDIVLNYVPLKDIFKSQTINNITSKEVTVTDEGIADAVEKLYDATVIVKVGKNGKTAGWGSGFVYKTDDKYGYILTNHHVVDEATEITVAMTDDSETEGTLLGSDEYADVAVVRIPVDKVLAVAAIGKTEGLRVGDTVFAVGTPVSLDYSFTVTRGILSGTNRVVAMQSSNSGQSIFKQQTGETWYMTLLQIDASINSGNSGGPLANCNGEVVGITNSKLSSSYSSTTIENMGFAIPIEDALAVAESLESGGSVTRPTLGVSMTSVEGAEYNKVKISESIKYGAVVVEVQNGSTADKAGLKSGDVIVKLNDYRVKDYTYLKAYLYRYKVGDTVKMTYIRDGKEKTIEVELKG